MSNTREHEMKEPLINNNDHSQNTHNQFLFFNRNKMHKALINKIIIPYLKNEDIINLKKSTKQLYGNVDLKFRNKWSDPCWLSIRPGIKSISKYTIDCVPHTTNTFEGCLIGTLCCPCILSGIGLSFTWGTTCCLLGTSGYIVGGLVDGSRYISSNCTNNKEYDEIKIAPKRQVMR